MVGEQLIEFFLSHRSVLGLAELFGGDNASHQEIERLEVNANVFSVVEESKGLFQIENLVLVFDFEQTSGSDLVLNGNH